MTEKSPKHKTIVEKITGTYGSVNKIWGILALFTMGLLIFQAATGNIREASIPEEILNFKCLQTPSSKLVKPPKTTLNTALDISTINLDTEIAQVGTDFNSIPAVYSPKFTNYDEINNCVGDNEEVIVLEANNTVKIYPRKILANHLAVNDLLVGTPVLITYSGMSNSYAVYVREYKNEIMTFGVTGLVYKNNDLLYDFKSDSMWSQFDGKSRVGALTGAQLQTHDFILTTYAEAKKQYPEAEVLSFDTGYRRNYSLDSYSGFGDIQTVVSPVLNKSQKLELKQEVIGFIDNGRSYVLPASSLKDGKYSTEIAGKEIKVTHKDSQYFVTIDNKQIQPIRAYWYVWYDFYPETLIIN